MVFGIDRRLDCPFLRLKNCELLRDAQIFREDTRISRNGRNIYKVFSLTDFGRQIAEELKKESEIAPEPEGDSL